MRILNVLAVAFLFSAAMAFAHDGKGGACSAYMTQCKTDPSVTAATGKAKWKAMHECVATAAKADTTNGQACVDEMSKHHGHKHPAPAQAAPAPSGT